MKWCNPFIHNVEKWLNIPLKSCGVNVARFLKHVWPFLNPMNERVNHLVELNPYDLADNKA